MIIFSSVNIEANKYSVCVTGRMVVGPYIPIGGPFYDPYCRRLALW